MPIYSSLSSLTHFFPVLAFFPISSFSIFFVDNELASRARPKIEAEVKTEVKAEAVVEVASQARDTMSSEKNEDTKKVRVSLMLLSLSLVM